MSDVTTWIERAITLVIGGGALKIGEYFIQKKKADNDDFTLLRETYREEFKRYEDKVDKLISQNTTLELKIEALQKETDHLREQLVLLRTIHPDLPIPMWLKDQNGIMLSLNQAYEDAFLFPQGKNRSDYIGRRDEDVWGDDVADLFRANDLVAIAQKQTSFVVENKGNKLFSGWEFFKYPKYADGIFIGIGGIALPRDNKK